MAVSSEIAPQMLGFALSLKGYLLGFVRNWGRWNLTVFVEGYKKLMVTAIYHLTPIGVAGSAGKM